MLCMTDFGTTYGYLPWSQLESKQLWPILNLLPLFTLQGPKVCNSSLCKSTLGTG